MADIISDVKENKDKALFKYCKKFEKNDIILVGDVRIPVSRDRKQMTKEQFMIGRRR